MVWSVDAGSSRSDSLRGEPYVTMACWEGARKACLFEGRTPVSTKMPLAWHKTKMVLGEDRQERRLSSFSSLLGSDHYLKILELCRQTTFNFRGTFAISKFVFSK